MSHLLLLFCFLSLKRSTFEALFYITLKARDFKKLRDIQILEFSDLEFHEVAKYSIKQGVA